jgi:PAS domain S-box-containing protein
MGRMLINLFQDLSFPFSPHFFWNRIWIGWFSKFLKLTRSEWNRFTDLTIVQVVTYLSFALVIVVLANTVYVAQLFYKRKFDNIWSLKFLRAVAGLFAGIFYIPFLTALGWYLRCPQEKADKNECLIIGVGIVEAVFILIVMAMFIALAIAYSSTTYCWWTFSGSLFARSHSKANDMELYCRTVTVLLFGLLEERKELLYKYILVASCVANGVFIGFANWYYLAYFNHKVNAVLLSSSAIQLWAGICAAITVSLYAKEKESPVNIAVSASEDTGSSFLFFLGVIPAIAASQYIVKLRIQEIEKANHNSLKSPVEVDIKSRLMLASIFQQQEKERRAQGDIKEDNDTIVEACHQVDELFTSAIKKFPDSGMVYLSWGTHAFIMKKNRFLSMSKFRAVLECKPTISDLLSVHVRLRFVADYTTSGQKERDMIAEVEQQTLEATVVSNMTKCVGYQLDFWKNLQEDKTRRGRLEKLTKLIDRSMRITRVNCHKLIKLNPQSAYYRRLYAQYLLNIVNDESSGNHQLNRALALESETKGQLSDSKDSQNGSVIVSGENGHIGEILQVNAKACSIFGYGNNDLVGKNINILMPRPFSELHNSFLMKYVETGKGKLINNRVILPVKGKQGYLFLCELFVREYANHTLEPSIAFMSLLMPVTKDNMIAIIQKDMLVVEASIQCLDFFSSSIQALKEEQVSVTEWMPTYLDCLDRMNHSEVEGQSTFTTKEHNGQDHVTLMIRVMNIEFHGSESYTQLIIEKKDRSATGNNNDTFSDSGSEGGRSEESSTTYSTSQVGPKKKKKRGRINWGIESRNVEDGQSVKDWETESSESADDRKLSLKVDDSNSLGSRILPSESSINMGPGKATNTRFNQLIAQSRSSMGQSINTISSFGGMRRATSQAGSVVSGGSSNTSRNSRLLRMGLDAQADVMDPTLTRLLKNIMVTSCFLCLCAFIAHLLWMFGFFQKYVTVLQLLSGGNSIRWGMVTCEYIGYFLAQMERKFVSKSDLLTIQEELASFVQNVDYFVDLVSNSTSSIDLVQRNLLFNPSVKIYLAGSNSSQLVGLIDALQLYSSITSRIVKSLSLNGTMDVAILPFFKKNAPGNIISVLKQVIDMLAQSKKGIIHFADSWSSGLLYGSIGMFVILLLVVYIPTVYLVERTKNGVYGLFESIPPANIQEVIAMCNEKYSNLVKTHEDSEDAKVELDDITVTKRKDDNRRRTAKAGKKKMWNGISDLKGILSNTATARLSIITILVIVYFSTLHYWWITESSRYVTEIPIDINRMGYRCFIARKVTVELLRFDFESNVFSPNMDVLRDLEKDLINYETTIVYADNPLGLVDEFDLYSFSNLCLKCMKENGCKGFNVPSCSRVNFGIMKRGTHEMVLSYYSALKKITRLIGNKTLWENTSSMEIANIRILSDDYVLQALYDGFQDISNTFLRELNNMYNSRWIILISFIALNILLVMLFYRPMVKKFDAELKRTRYMVIMLPPEVIENIPALRNQIKQVLVELFRS